MDAYLPTGDDARRESNERYFDYERRHLRGRQGPDSHLSAFRVCPDLGMVGSGGRGSVCPITTVKWTPTIEPVDPFREKLKALVNAQWNQAMAARDYWRAKQITRLGIV